MWKDMGGYGGGWGIGFGMIGMVLLCVIITFGIVVIVRRTSGSGQHSNDAARLCGLAAMLYMATSMGLRHRQCAGAHL
ncbi:MAG: hypothetical protein ABI304_12155 [Rudaea sp.]